MSSSGKSFVSPEAIQSGLVRENESFLPLSEFRKNSASIGFATYNICGFYFSSINHCKHFLAGEIHRVIESFKSKDEKSGNKVQLDPQVIGSLYADHLKGYMQYLISWLVADRFFVKREAIKSIADVESVLKEVIQEYVQYREKLVDFLLSLKGDEKHKKNAKLIDVLVVSLRNQVNEKDIKNSEVLKFAFEKSKIEDFHKEIAFGKNKRSQFKRWQPWYKRQQAVFSFMDHVIDKMGINIFNLQEGNAESLMQLQKYLKEKHPTYSLLSYSDQDGSSMANLEPVEAEGFKAKDGLGFANAIVFDTDRYALVQSKQFWISETPDKPSMTPGGLSHQKNSITAAVLYDKSHNKKFIVFNTHITPNTQGHEFSRNKIIELVNKYVSEHGNIPYVISGDFNTYPDVSAEAKHYSEYVKQMNVIDFRDLFKGKICANKVVGPTTYMGYGIPGDVPNSIDEKSEALRAQYLDQWFSNGFDASGNAFKLAAPLVVNEDSGECHLNLESELNDISGEKIKKPIKNRTTTSDHLLIGGLFKLKTNEPVVSTQLLAETGKVLTLGK
jgi:hypothetical protein